MNMNTALSLRGRRALAAARPRSRSTSRRMPAAVLVSVIWLAVVILAAITAPILPIPDPSVSDYAAVGAFPGQSLEHLLGADQIGRDMLSRLITGAQVSLTVGVGSVLLGTIAGGFLGLAAGYFGGWWDRVLSVAIDIMLSFPGIVAIIAITVFMGPSMSTLVIGMGILFVPQLARVARSATLSFAQREFVVAARGMGAGEFRILIREVLPNIVAAVVAYATTLVAVAIVMEGGLSFLGLGVPAPQSSWGSMMGDGRASLKDSPHIVLLPALVMCITLLAINFVADYVSKRFDIRESVL